MIDVTNSQDLRTTYLYAFDAFAITPGDLVETSEGRVNMRYARELLGTLVTAGLLTVTDVNDEGDVWQVANPGTYDNHTRDEAEVVIDAWLKGTKSADKVAAPTTSSSSGGSRLKVKNESGKCRCGCDESTKSNYRPGHDARHAGQVGREIAANYATKGFDRRTLLAALPSDALKAKAERIAEIAVEKANKKGKETGPAHLDGIIQVGKTERVARKFSSSNVVSYLDEKGEWVEASKTAAKTFTVE